MVEAQGSQDADVVSVELTALGISDVSCDGRGRGLAGSGENRQPAQRVLAVTEALNLGEFSSMEPVA